MNAVSAQSRQPIGRIEEIAQVGVFLDASRAGMRALAVTGPAGIGKTTIWAEGLRRAREEGRFVLAARPSGAEAQLSFAGLGDLLDAVDETVFDALTPLQRRAIDAALLRTEIAEDRVDGRAVATGLLAVLRNLARREPLLLAVDDAQWLDRPTAEALGFAVRRLEELPVGVLVSVRIDGARPDTFERVAPPLLREEITLPPLSTAALHDVLERELGLVFPRPQLVRIVTACDGNPFYALEIARELARTGMPTPGEPLPVPEEVQALVRSRLSRLPQPTQEALLVASALSRPTTETVNVESLLPAEETGVVRVESDGRIRFSHPLLAAAVYDTAPAGRKRRVHRALAEQLDDPEERARHLSLVTDRPDETVAAALDIAAEHAAARGASTAAAELARRALELTPEPQSEVAVRRALRLAHELLETGDSAQARATLEACDPAWVEGDVRADLLSSLGKILWYDRDVQGGYEKFIEALAHVRDPKRAARIHAEAAFLSHDSQPLRGIEHADAVLQLLDPRRDAGLFSQALLLGAYLRLITGQGADTDAYERGVALQRDTAWEDNSAVVGMWPLVLDDFERSKNFYEFGLERSRAEGDELSVQGTLIRLAEIELWTGNWARAERYANEVMELADRIGSNAYLGSSLYVRAYLDAHVGHVERARAAATRILEVFPVTDVQTTLGWWVLGFLALSQNDPAAADEHLTRAAAIVDALGQREPARYRFHADLVEAVIQLGDFERAETLLAELEHRSRICPRPWILATSARCRGLLFAARGELDEARAAMEEALEHHEPLDMPFERARTLLVFGQLLRRRKARREARLALEEALSVFERLGANLWAERATAELARVRVRGAPAELSATEQTIAGLAATGLTNQAIAERMFVSRKTVEANLARAYRKLGIRNRAQLSRALEDRHAKAT